jgi:hypothetical protein
MKKTKQTLNAQHSTSNAELRGYSDLDIESWTLSVGPFLPALQ